MLFFEDILTVALSTLLLILIISVSQSVKARFGKLDVMEADLALGNSIAGIPVEELGDAEKLLSGVVETLDSSGVKWVSIELLSRKHGRIFLENKRVLERSSGRDARYVRIVRVSSGDTVVITVGVEND